VHRVLIGHLGLRCQIQIVPSKLEGFGIAAIEGMSHNACIIASNVAGLTDIIKHEENGLLVEYGDVFQLAHSIEKLINDSRFNYMKVVMIKTSYRDIYKLLILSKKFPIKEIKDNYVVPTFNFKNFIINLFYLINLIIFIIIIMFINQFIINILIVLNHIFIIIATILSILRLLLYYLLINCIIIIYNTIL
jgi:hypothetical protein